MRRYIIFLLCSLLISTSSFANSSSLDTVQTANDMSNGTRSLNTELYAVRLCTPIPDVAKRQACREYREALTNFKYCTPSSGICEQEKNLLFKKCNVYYAGKAAGRNCPLDPKVSPLGMSDANMNGNAVYGNTKLEKPADMSNGTNSLEREWIAVKHCSQIVNAVKQNACREYRQAIADFSKCLPDTGICKEQKNLLFKKCNLYYSGQSNGANCPLDPSIEPDGGKSLVI